MIEAILYVLALAAGYCIGRASRDPNLTPIKPRGYRRW